MVKKAKGKRGKPKFSIVEAKKNELQRFWDFFQSQCEEYEIRTNGICIETCSKIQKIYADKLKSLPENVKNMTLLEYFEMQNNAEQQEIKTNEMYRSEFELTKLKSAQKKTQKKAKQEMKRSMSTSDLSVSKLAVHQSFLARTSRVLSESCLSTPLSKRSVAPTYAVTPKFNPRVPINKSILRKPRAGEILMSLSGSPLQNFVEDIPDKPGVAVSLGGGKIIKITEDTDIGKLELDIAKKLDQETKITLENVKKKLDRILNS